MIGFPRRWLVLGALLLFYPPGKTTAGDQVGVHIVKDVLDQLWDYQSKSAEGKKHVGFDIPEMLVNQYIAYLIDSKTRLGVKAASIKIAGKNKVDADCVIDLNQLRRWIPDIVKSDPLLANKDDLKVTATATVDISDGMAKVSIVSARDAAGGAGIETIRKLFRAIGQHQPEHFDIDKPIKLPFDMSVAMNNGVVTGKTSK